MDRRGKTPQRMGSLFIWWQGVVEDVMDPKKLGRLKVRILGDHTQNKDDIMTSQLFWAMPIQPITSAAMNGIGQSPTGIVTGSWVFGFYRDDHDKQQPVVLGSMGGIPEDPPDGAVGFNDPNECWPMDSKLEEPDTNRLARGVTGQYADALTHDVHLTSVAEVQTGMPTCTDNWDEPETKREPIYPYNQVWESPYHEDCDGCKWGHIEEWDNTPTKERYFRWHKTSHNSLEIFPDGREVRKIYGDNFELDLASKHLRIDGDYRVTVKGNVDEHIVGDVWRYIEGKMVTVVEKDIITVSHAKVVTHSDDDNITKSMKGIHEISLKNNNRITNLGINDTGLTIKNISETESVIGTGSIPTAVVPEISPTDAYSYTPYDSITLKCDGENEAPGGKGGDLYSEIPPWDQTVTAAAVDFVKVVPGVIFHDTIDEHHTGINYMPELHVLGVTYVEDIMVESGVYTDSVDTRIITAVDVNSTNVEAPNGTFTDLESESMASDTFMGPTFIEPETGNESLKGISGTGNLSGTFIPTDPDPPTPWIDPPDPDISDTMLYDLFKYSPVDVAVTPPVPEEPWSDPEEC